MNWYRIRTIGGEFWIQAPRAAEAFHRARAILGHDEFALDREYELDWKPAS